MMTAADFNLTQLRRMPERELQERVRQMFEWHGWLYYHTWSSVHSASGFPDVIAYRPHRVIVAELKRVGKVPTAAQERWLEAFRAIGPPIEVYVWTSLDLDDIVQILQAEAP